MNIKFLLLGIFMSIFFISLASANNISLHPSPGTNYAGSNIQYSFNFTNSTNCEPANNLLTVTKFIQIDTTGKGFISIDISNLTQVPTKLCEGREGLLRANHSFSDIVFNTIYAKYLNISSNAIIKGRLNVTQNVSASWFIGKINASKIQNSPWYTTTQINNLGYYNLSDFSISNYYNKTQTDNNLTSRYVPYTGANKNINIGNNNLTVNGTTLFVNSRLGRVGIGTTSPGFTLDVSGSIKGSSRVIAGISTNQGVGIIPLFYGASDGAGASYIDSITAGAVIYGRRAGTSQAARSNVGNGQGLLDIRSAGYSGTTGYWDTASISFIVDAGVTDNQRPPSRIVFNTNTDGGAVSERMRIDRNGNVGIGTTTPDSKLEVNGTVKFTNVADNTASLTWDPTAQGNAGVLNAEFISAGNFYSESNSNLLFRQVGTNQNILFKNQANDVMMQIVSATGNVGIGTVSPQSKLHIIGTVNITSTTILYALKGTYGGGSAYVCVYNNGTLFASDVACP